MHLTGKLVCYAFAVYFTVDDPNMQIDHENLTKLYSFLFCGTNAELIGACAYLF